MTEPTGDLSPREREALAALPRELDPPAALEEATVAALRARGLLGRGRGRREAPARRRALLSVLGLAASLALFAAGFALGRREPTAPAPAASQYLLLLYEGPSYRHPASGLEDVRVGEYAEWAERQAAQGELVGGEKLREDADVVIGADGAVQKAPADPGAERLAGFFMIRAASRTRALEIARSCPHVRYGGSIVLREVEPT
jgi:hypothetical protein